MIHKHLLFYLMNIFILLQEHGLHLDILDLKKYLF